MRILLSCAPTLRVVPAHRKMLTTTTRLVKPTDAFIRDVVSGGKLSAEFTKQIGLSQPVLSPGLGFKGIAATQQKQLVKRTMAAAR